MGPLQNPVDWDSQSDALGVVNPIDHNRTLTVIEPSINRQVSDFSFEEQEQVQELSFEGQNKTKEQEQNHESLKIEEAPITQQDSNSSLQRKEPGQEPPKTEEPSTRQNIVDTMLEELALNIDIPGTKRFPSDWDLFIEHALARSKEGEDIHTFAKFWLREHPDCQYWGAKSMLTNWPMAFKRKVQRYVTPEPDKWDKKFVPAPRLSTLSTGLPTQPTLPIQGSRVVGVSGDPSEASTSPTPFASGANDGLASPPGGADFS